MSSYYSYWKEHQRSQPVDPYIKKDGVFMRSYPPLGKSIRDLFDVASSNDQNPWNTSDKECHTREIQSVGCRLTFAQDHTFDVLKNYMPKKIGATTLWDCATETGEIALAVLVPTTKTKHFAHAAKRLADRSHFNPQVMYSDTWLIKKDFWPLLFPRGIEGRLGLFHCIQRITKTLRKKHVDYHEAITKLLDAVYSYHSEDFEAVITALKIGTLGTSRKRHSDSEIAEMRRTRLFRQKYAKYIQKGIRQSETMTQLLDDWFVRFKVSASDGAREAQGRVDPRAQQSLFTAETKGAIIECKKKARFLSDPLPLSDMYHVIAPNPNAAHKLPQYL